MRLRSSKFVVLLLLACCVQLVDDSALRLFAAPGLRSAQRVNLAVTPPGAGSTLRTTLRFRPAVAALHPTARALTEIAWTMRRPAADSAALMQHTGFLRT